MRHFKRTREAKRMATAEIVRSLVKEIILTPEDGELQIDV
jgi:site-specific DNA recombinase